MTGTRAAIRWLGSPWRQIWSLAIGLCGRFTGFGRSLTAFLPVTPDDLPRLAAQAHLRGRGIEIGALHHPLRLPRGATVRYVDRMNVTELREHYPELRQTRLVEVDVVDDGERLARFVDGSEDFIVANHFLEHCQDPIGTLKNMFRVLRAGGILYLTLPDKRKTFDRERPVTNLAHLRADHELGTDSSRRAHYEEWVYVVEGHSGAKAAKRITDLVERKFSIHFHVWTLQEMLEMLVALSDEVGFEMVTVCNREKEHTFVLKKVAPPSFPAPTQGSDTLAARSAARASRA